MAKPARELRRNFNTETNTRNKDSKRATERVSFLSVALFESLFLVFVSVLKFRLINHQLKKRAALSNSPLTKGTTGD